MNKLVRAAAAFTVVAFTPVFPVNAGPLPVAPQPVFDPLPAPKPLKPSAITEAMPVLSSMEKAENLELMPTVNGWIVGKTNVYFACSPNFNVQVILPVAYEFDFDKNQTPQQRLDVAHKTDAFVNKILTVLASDRQLLSTMQSQHHDPRPVVENLLKAYSQASQNSQYALAIDVVAPLIPAAGCGGIHDQNGYSNAMKNLKKLYETRYL